MINHEAFWKLVFETPERGKLLLQALAILKTVDTCIEIGVATGNHAAAIKSILNPKKLYLLDAWGLDEAYLEITKESPAEFYHALWLTQAMFFGDAAVEIIQGKSTVEHKRFEDGDFDFIYIDANHSYDAVKKDLENWFPKLRSGGVFAGHDYCEKTGFGVIQAVDEFRANNIDKIKNFTTYGSGLQKCWMVET